MILTRLSDSSDTLSDIRHEFLQAATSAAGMVLMVMKWSILA